MSRTRPHPAPARTHPHLPAPNRTPIAITLALLAALGCGTAADQPRSATADQARTASGQASAAAWLPVRQVIDGDTITVSGIGTVRLIGVDAPEKTGGYRASEPYGDAATRYLRGLMGGRKVRLEYDGARKDQYNRTLAYVFLEDGTLVNLAIIKAGFAETYRRFDYRRKPEFLAAEGEARAARRGMWAGRRPRVRSRRRGPDNPLAVTSSGR